MADGMISKQILRWTINQKGPATKADLGNDRITVKSEQA